MKNQLLFFMKPTYFLIYILVFSLSCSGVKRSQKFISGGDYDRAVALTVKKLKNKTGSKDYDTQVRILEEAYDKAVIKDTRKIQILERERFKNAKEIYFTYLDLEQRQEKIKPLLPLYDSTGKPVLLKINDYSRRISAAKQNYLDFLYEEAHYYLNLNTKEDFRTAYHVLCELEEAAPGFKDAKRLKEQALFAGTDFVLVTLNNYSGQFIPLNLEQALLDFDTYGLHSQWTVFHTYKQSGISYSHAVDLNFELIQISPEQLTEREFTRKKQIREGSDYLRDRGGNIVRDSLGKPVKIDKLKEVQAQVLISSQRKAVLLGGVVLYKIPGQNRILNRYPLSSEFIFENSFAVYSGDKRALSEDDRILTGNRFIPFPTHEEMVFDAGILLKERLKTILKNEF